MSTEEYIYEDKVLQTDNWMNNVIHISILIQEDEWNENESDL